MKKSLLFCLSLLLLVSAVAFGEEKEGYVDLSRVFNEFYKTVRENYNLGLRRQGFEDQMRAMDNEFKSGMQDYEELVEQAENELLGENAREEAKKKAIELEERLQQKQMELQQNYQQCVQDLQRVQTETEERLIAELTEKVRNFAEARGYTRVFDVSGRSLNRVPVLMIYPKDQEITDEIIRIINLGHEQEKADALKDIELLEKKATAK